MTKEKDILEFIRRRFEIDCHWTDGNCYWFALILNKRFPDTEIMYLPVPGHFVVCSPEGKMYDWTGEVEGKVEDAYGMNWMKLYEPQMYERVMNACYE